VSDRVIDASVAIKWVIQEDGTAEALALRRLALAAPDLLVAECANVLWRKVRKGELSEDEALYAARLLARVEIDLMPMRPYLEAAVGLAAALDHPAYDCVYLALAEAENIPFVTADRSFLNKARRHGWRSVIPLVDAIRPADISR
jgi:predicted nucleic acid-binding protein